MAVHARGHWFSSVSSVVVKMFLGCRCEISRSAGESAPSPEMGSGEWDCVTLCGARGLWGRGVCKGEWEGNGAVTGVGVIRYGG